MSKKKKIIKIYEHELIPKHIRLSQDEVQEVLARYQVHPYQLPNIKASDPAISALKTTPGEIVKIIRESKTSGEAIAYRYVIEG